jgi:hypothetical protein
LVLLECDSSAPLHVSFSQSDSSVEAYDFVEVAVNVSWQHARNPFTDATFKGWFETADGSRRWPVEGFCDSGDGNVFLIRVSGWHRVPVCPIACSVISEELLAE